MTTTVAMPTQIRRWPRLRLNLPVTILCSAGTFAGRASDVSKGGVTILCPSELALGQTVELEFAPPLTESAVRIKAIVRNSFEDIYGVEFVLNNESDHESLAALSDTLGSLSAPL
jgi:PilZ domain